ncbi:methyltransferase domain-containing protein [Nonomuraea sp. NBC_00507]|uniref:methyltransferase domain-containing protein n=1 Tax=Nonomuraea sp. NBC_00507 TaxID=2976002 RepID=UPI002E17C7AC
MDRLIAELDPDGEVRDFVKQAIRAVPRHLFIPTVGLISPRDKTGKAFLIDHSTDPNTWLDTVYSDTSVVTQLNDGTTALSELEGDYTSSASAPSTVADLLDLLDPDPGNRVLEIGTGTGWTAALLLQLVGVHGSVTSIEVDAEIAEQAAKSLDDAGCHPNLIVGDGTKGHAEHAPFDRVHVTCGIRAVPYAWVEQCRPGAKIVLPYCPNFGENHSVRLMVLQDGTAVGRFRGFASYMPIRSQRYIPDQPARGPRDKHWVTTRIDPRTIAYASAGADLAISAITGLSSSSMKDADEDGELFRMWVSDPTTAYSWAVVEWRPDQEQYSVYQVGDRPVWDEVVDAYFRWVSWGEPGRDRFGLTITQEGQQIWLDSPEHVLS